MKKASKLIVTFDKQFYGCLFRKMWRYFIWTVCFVNGYLNQLGIYLWMGKHYIEFEWFRPFTHSTLNYLKVVKQSLKLLFDYYPIKFDKYVKSSKRAYKPIRQICEK